MAKVRKKKVAIAKQAMKKAIQEGEMKIVKMSSIKLWDDNPRKNAGAVAPLAKILKEHGQVTPVVVHRKDNMIRKGNTTYKAMKKNGEKEILVLFVDFPSTAMANAYGIADNKSSEWAEWDNELLSVMMRAKEFTSLDNDNLSALTGLKEQELKGLMMAEDFPDELPDVDIQGTVDGKSDFIVIQFESKTKLAKFKKRLGLDEKFARVVPEKLLFKNLKWKVKGK